MLEVVGKRQDDILFTGIFMELDGKEGNREADSCSWELILYSWVELSLWAMTQFIQYLVAKEICLKSSRSFVTVRCDIIAWL